MCANPIQTNTAHVFQTMLRIVSLGFETSIKHLHHFLIGPNLVLMCHTLRIRSRSSPTPWSYLPRVIYPWQSRHTQYSNSPCASPLVIYLATLRVDTPSTLIAHVSPSILCGVTQFSPLNSLMQHTQHLSPLFQNGTQYRFISVMYFHVCMQSMT